MTGSNEFMRLTTYCIPNQTSRHFRCFILLCVFVSARTVFGLVYCSTVDCALDLPYSLQN